MNMLWSLPYFLYVSALLILQQQPWTFNETLRENILFGQEYDAKRYANIISRCCLQPDLDILPAGDLTEIGEKGINLSGRNKSSSLHCFFISD
jgi:ABC-type multidrug transport system fused ATPase/permease subunit